MELRHLRHLRYLVAVADAGSFAGGAELMRVAQPALTRQLHDFARELGVDLFEKGARKATLTKAGDASVRLARHVLRDVDLALQRVRMSSLGQVGRCVLLAGPFPIISGLVGKLVARVQAAYPGIELVLTESEGAEGWSRIANGEADIGLSVAPSGEFPSLIVETQFTDTVQHAVLHRDHPLASLEEVTPADLRKHPLFLPEAAGNAMGPIVRLLSRELERVGGEAVSVHHLSSFSSLLTHVAAHNGWTLMPTSISSRLAPLVAIPIRGFRLPLQAMRIWRRADDRPVVRTVISELRAMTLEDTAGPTPPGGVTRQRASATSIPQRLELRHLRSYMAVVEHGSFGRAAEALEITQPALSRQMKDLEYDVGVPLFDRGTRGVDLLPTGQEFANDVRAVLAVVDQLNKEAHRAQRGTSQQCVIGMVPHPIVESLVAYAVGHLESDSNRVRLGTTMLGTPSMPEALLQSEIDLALGFTYPARTPPVDQLAHVRLYDDELSHAMMSRKHPLAKAKSLSLADLEDVPLLFPGRATFPPVYDVVMHQVGLAGVRPRIESTYEGVLVLWAMAAEGLGWVPGLRRQAEDPPMGLVSIPLRDFSLPWGGELLYRRDESRAPVLGVIDCIVARAVELFGKQA